jgi:choline dehydrogenase-like flavoprotein
MTTTRGGEVVVVGTGAGGAVTAVELARHGYHVTLLEEGPRPPLSDYGRDAGRAMQLLYRHRGMTPILGPVPVAYVEGCCVGGSTEINSGFWHRTPPEMLLRWKAQFDLVDAAPHDLDPHFAWAEELLAVGPALVDPPSTRVFARGIEAMAWSHQHQGARTRTCARADARRAPSRA